MPSIDNLFGNYLKKTEIIGEPVYTIKQTKIENVGREEDPETKLVVYFNETDRGLVINKINAEAIAEIAKNRDYDTWIGVKVKLYIDPNVMYSGQRIGGIRIKATN